MTDLRYALRQLNGARRFTVLAVTALGVGLGATALTFAALNAIVLRPLPCVRDEARLVDLTATLEARGEPDLGVAAADFADWRACSRTLSDLFLVRSRTVVFQGTRWPVRLNAAEISPQAFATLGVAPTLGRDLTATDVGAVLVSERFRQQYLPGGPVLGRRIKVDQQNLTIVGVMPAGWHYPRVADLWIPLGAEAVAAAGRGMFMFECKGRLAATATLATAQAELSGLAAELAERHPETNAGIGVRVAPLRAKATEDVRRFALLLFGASICVLLIACANVANLVFARTAGRSHEIAIRLALGARRWRVIGQLMTECSVLAAAGALLGVGLAGWSLEAVQAILPEDTPFWMRFDVDGRVIAFVALASVAATLLCGLAPALRATRPQFLIELKDGARGLTVGRLTRRLRETLVVAQVAVTVVVLVGGGLMFRSFLALVSVDRGFATQHVFTLRTGLGQPGSAAADSTRFYEDVERRVAALPGVQSAGVINTLPALPPGARGRLAVVLEGQPSPQRYAEIEFPFARVASRGYFETLEIPLRSGRLFGPSDERDAPKVAVVDEAFVRRTCADGQAIGKRFRLLFEAASATPGWIKIVGVVGNVRHRLEIDEAEPTIYLPATQHPRDFMTVVVRRDREDGTAPAAIEAAIRAADPAAPVYQQQSLNAVVQQSQWAARLFGGLFACSAAIALFLAVLGIYGLMAAHATERLPEVELRLALGATEENVATLIIHRGLRLVLTGLLLGTAAAFYLAQLFGARLYRVSPHDPLTFALVLLLLGGVAGLACWWPARRMARVATLGSLRTE